MIKPLRSNFNRHIVDLARQLDGRSEQHLDYLVIAHSAPDMLERIRAAFSDYSIAIVAIPQPEWDMQADQIDELLGWAVNELNVNGILLAGHSIGGTPLQAVHVCEAPDERLESITMANRMISVLERIENAQRFRKSNENHFLYELESLQNSPSIYEQTLRNSSFVQGILYRSESGLFCTYDHENGTFNALINEERVI